ncbi:hypothetical protein KCU64_g1481, partial [Aureobasidium melanogenum]
MCQLNEDKRKDPGKSEFGKPDWRTQLITVTNKNKALNSLGSSAVKIKIRIALSTRTRSYHGRLMEKRVKPTSKHQSQVLDATLMRLVQIIRDETVYAINALLLMSLLSRARDEPEIAWHMLTTAVARAIAVGLDRRLTSSEKLKPQYQSRIDTWWSLFVLDKVLAVELQRPPMIRDCFHDQEMPWINGPNQGHPSLQNCFLAIIDLAKIQEKVLEALLRCSRAEASGRVTLYEAVNDKMRISGELDQLLATWAERLPFDLKYDRSPRK